MQLRILLNFALPALMIVSLTACSTMARHHDAFPHKAFTQSDDGDQLSGEWNVTFFVQGQTTPATFSLKLDGKNVTGTAYSEHTGPGTIRDGNWDNGKLSFTLDFKKHESIAITGALQDGKLSGEFRTEGFVSKWEAKKK